MRTIILYASKHGAAGEIAQRIAGRINGAVIHNLNQKTVPSLADFDCVIIGGSVYAGMIRKEIKTFMAHNADSLRGKKLGLFLCGLDFRQEKEYFNANFPADILQAARAKSFLGGIFDPKKTGVMERLIMKAVAKRTAYANTIDDSRIEQFT